MNLQFGSRLNSVVVTLAEGAASVRGRLNVGENKKAPAGLSLYLVPAEKEKTEDVLRFFTTPVVDDGTFALNNLSPGRYWAIARIPAAEEARIDWKLRLPDQAQNRLTRRKPRLRNSREEPRTQIATIISFVWLNAWKLSLSWEA